MEKTILGQGRGKEENYFRIKGVEEISFKRFICNV